MVSTFYVRFSTSNLFIRVDVYPQTRRFLIGFHRKLPFVKCNFIDGDVIHATNLSRSPFDFSDASSRSILEKYKYVEIALHNVLATYPRNVMTDCSDWVVGWSGHGNSMLLDSDTLVHLRLSHLFKMDKMPPIVRNYFNNYWKEFIFTDASVLVRVHEEVIKVEPFLFLQNKFLKLLKGNTFMKTNLSKGDMLFASLRSRIDLYNELKETNVCDWLFVVFDSMDKIIFYDQQYDMMKHRNKIFHEKCLKDVIMEDKYCNIGILQNDFVYKVPIGEYKSEHGVVLRVSNGIYYVQTLTCVDYQNRVDCKTAELLEEYVDKIDLSICHEFLENVNNMLERLHILCMLFVLCQYNHLDGRCAISSETNLIGIRSLDLIIDNFDSVCNDYSPGVSPMVLSSLMGSGKSSYVLSVGIVVVMNQLGVPYLATNPGISHLKIYPSIYIVKDQSDDQYRRRGSFENHILQLSMAINGLSGSLALIDEPCISTKFSDAKQIIEGILGNVTDKEIILSTHIVLDVNLHVDKYHFDKFKLVRIDNCTVDYTLHKWLDNNPDIMSDYMGYVSSEIMSSRSKS